MKSNGHIKLKEASLCCVVVESGTTINIGMLFFFKQWCMQYYIYKVHCVCKMVDQKLQQYLEGFLSETRLNRFKEVLENRTRHATIVLEDVYQPQNASAVIRTAECLGLQDVYIIENTFRYNVNKQIVRGANKWIDIHKYAGNANNTQVCIQDLKLKGYTVLATSPGENTRFLDELDPTQKTAFVFGTEKFGVSDEVLAQCDGRVKIPMYGFTESYNLSVSMALCLYSFLEKARKTNQNWALTKVEKEELYHAWTKKAIKKSKLIVQEFFTNSGGKI